MIRFYIIIGIMLSTFFSSETEPSHALFSDILNDYVHDGRVNYAALCKDERLEAYVQQLSRTNPDTITDESDRFAFWLNAYNAFTLKIICDNYPIESINELHWGGLYIGTILKTTIWHKKFITVNQKSLSLNSIEHDIVRARFKDARAHFALVCASKSCPSLRSEAYEGYKLDQQLSDQGRLFFNQASKNHFDVELREAYLSKILDWFAEDFGENDEQILLFVAQFLSEDHARDIRENTKAWDISHTEYDWSLNN